MRYLFVSIISAIAISISSFTIASSDIKAGDLVKVSNGGNLREGNSRNTKIIAKSDGVEVFLVLPRPLENDFAQVKRSDGSIVFVHISQLKPAFPSPD